MRTAAWTIAAIAGLIAIAALALAACDGGEPRRTSAAERTTAVALSPGAFAATTPCDPASGALPGVPEAARCEMAIWRIDLDADGTFELDLAFGMSEPNTMGLHNRGTTVKLSGTWTSTRQATSGGPMSLIVLSDPRKGTVRLAQVSDDLLHLIDPRARLMVGNGGWSYTINRSTPQPDGSPAPGREHGATLAPLSLAGTFEGRSPCEPRLAGLMGIPVAPDCQRLKLSLAFAQDPDDRTRGGYRVRGVQVGDDRRGERGGTWQVVDDAPTTVELRPADSEPVRYLVVDAHNLYLLGTNGAPVVGDEYLSLTLSRRP